MSDRLLTTRELAETLGVTAKTVLRWTAALGLPGYRIGRALRYREGEVGAWLYLHATADGATEEESPTTDAARQAPFNTESPTQLRGLRSATTEEDS